MSTISENNMAESNSTVQSGQPHEKTVGTIISGNGIAQNVAESSETMESLPPTEEKEMEDMVDEARATPPFLQDVDITVIDAEQMLMTRYTMVFCAFSLANFFL